jgi:hypothetical protein
MMKYLLFSRKKLKIFMITATYGKGLHVIYTGDLKQLEPPGQGGKPLYEEQCQ